MERPWNNDHTHNNLIGASLGADLKEFFNTQDAIESALGCQILVATAIENRLCVYTRADSLYAPKEIFRFRPGALVKSQKVWHD